MTQKLEIDIIELPKIIGKEKEQDNLLDWLYFLENPKSERVTEKMKENENLKEAVKKLGQEQDISMATFIRQTILDQCKKVLGKEDFNQIMTNQLNSIKPKKEKK